MRLFLRGASGAQLLTRLCAAAYIRKLSQKRSPPLLTYLRPALVLYDESPPHAAPTTIAQVAQSDLDAKPDFVLVMGTSLKIPGFKDLVRKFAREAQRGGGMCVLVNGEKVGREWDAVFDYQGECSRSLFSVGIGGIGS